MEPQEMSPEEKEVKATEQGITVEELETNLQEEETARTAELADRAAEEGKTVEELETEIAAEREELTGMANKYDSDPLKMAKALRSSAQEATRLKERESVSEARLREAEERLATKEPAKPALNTQEDLKQHLMDDYSKKHPMVDEAVVALIVDSNMDTAAGMRAGFQIDKAQSNVSTEKQSFSSDPYYKRYQKEVDALVKAQPPQAQAQKGIVERCLNMVVGAHRNEIAKEAPKKPEEKEIIGQIKGAKSSTTSIGGRGEGTLTSEQTAEMARLGLTKVSSYLALLKTKKEKAKKLNKPEPTLITEKIS